MMHFSRLCMLVVFKTHRIPYVYSRDDVEHRGSDSTVREVECESISNASTTIVSVRN